MQTPVLLRHPQFLQILLFLVLSFDLHSQCVPTPIVYNGLAVALPPSGSFSLPAEVFNAGSIDECSAAPLNFSYSSDPQELTRLFDCDDLGTQLVDIWVSDQDGNQNYATTYVQVQDQGNYCPPFSIDCGPVAIAYNGLSVDLSAGPLTLLAVDFDAGSLDLCHTGSLKFDIGLSGSGLLDSAIVVDCSFDPVVILELQVTDALGNQSTVETYLLISDEQDFCGGNSPISPCGPAPVLINGLAVGMPLGGQFQLPTTAVFAKGIDGCVGGNLQMTLTDPGGTPDFNATSLLVECPSDETRLIEGHIRDNAGNTTFATSYLLLQNHLSPYISCLPGLNVELMPPGFQSISASDFVTAAAENCQGIPQLSFSSDPGDVSRLLSCLDVGTVPLTIYATDQDGRQSSCETEVTVLTNQVDCESCTGTQYDLTGTIGPDHYRASDYINASGTVDQFAYFQAANSIALLPGFSAPAGAFFQATIAPCTDPAPLIELPETKAVAGKAEVKVFPNPFYVKSTIQVHIPEPGPLRVYLIAPSGRVLSKLADNPFFTENYWETSLPDEHLPPGIYFLHLEIGDQSMVRKLVRLE